MKTSGDLAISHAVMGCKTFLQIVRAALREILDESAYDRFLLQTKDSRSAESYRAFMHEKEKGMAQRPKCC